MARPSKARRVFRLPRYRSFAPAEGSTPTASAALSGGI